MRLVVSWRHGPRGPSPRSHLLSSTFETAQGFLVRSRSSLDYHINWPLYNFYRHASPIFLPSFRALIRPFRVNNRIQCSNKKRSEQLESSRIKIFNDNFFLCLFELCYFLLKWRAFEFNANFSRDYVASLEIFSRLG